MPCFSALRAQIALPAAERGPVDFNHGRAARMRADAAARCSSVQRLAAIGAAFRGLDAGLIERLIKRLAEREEIAGFRLPCFAARAISLFAGFSFTLRGRFAHVCVLHFAQAHARQACRAYGGNDVARSRLAPACHCGHGRSLSHQPIRGGTARQAPGSAPPASPAASARRTGSTRRATARRSCRGKWALLPVCEHSVRLRSASWAVKGWGGSGLCVSSVIKAV